MDGIGIDHVRAAEILQDSPPTQLGVGWMLRSIKKRSDDSSASVQLRPGERIQFRKAPDMFEFLRHVMRAFCLSDQSALTDAFLGREPPLAGTSQLA